MAPDSSRCLRMVPKMLQEAPRTLQDGPKRPPRPPSRPPKSQILQTPEGHQDVLRSRRFASDGHPGPQDVSKMTQKSLK
eukprot:7882833-Pyramimonas_sp.AAC.1